MSSPARPGRLAYFEWSADDADPSDPEKTLDPGKVPDHILDDPHVWAQANPGMGIRIAEEHIQAERDGLLGRRAFAVERLGIGDWPDTDEDAGRKIPRAAWAACLEAADTVDPASIAPVCLAFDVAPDQSSAAIGVAGPRADGRWTVAIIAHGPGDDWVVDDLADLAREHRPLAVAWNKLGEANQFAEALKRAKVRRLTPIDTREFVQACAGFYSAVVPPSGSPGQPPPDPLPRPKLVHIGQPELDEAVAGAGERTLTDAWAWSALKSSADITPLNTVTLALWVAMSKKRGRGSAADVGSLAERAQAQAAEFAARLKT